MPTIGQLVIRQRNRIRSVLDEQKAKDAAKNAIIKPAKVIAPGVSGEDKRNLIIIPPTNHRSGTRPIFEKHNDGIAAVRNLDKQKTALGKSKNNRRMTEQEREIKKAILLAREAIEKKAELEKKYNEFANKYGEKAAKNTKLYEQLCKQ